MRLMREIRFSVGPAETGSVTNSWAGWPSATGVQPYLTLRARVEGEPDPTTGYLCNIKVIDTILRERAIPLTRRLTRDQSPTAERLITAIAGEVADNPPPGTRWVDWQLHTTPFLSYTVTSGALDMVHMTQSFEFSAAHRLHCPDLTESQNQEIFGKCNNPRGHGHNYQIEVTIAGEPDAGSGLLSPVDAMERIVKAQVVDRFDHKHLNEDCAEFGELNPSVENITRVIWSLLDGKFVPARLQRVRVWETPKTCAEYGGG